MPELGIYKNTVDLSVLYWGIIIYSLFVTVSCLKLAVSSGKDYPLHKLGIGEGNKTPIYIMFIGYSKVLITALIVTLIVNKYSWLNKTLGELGTQILIWSVGVFLTLFFFWYLTVFYTTIKDNYKVSNHKIKEGIKKSALINEKEMS